MDEGFDIREMVVSDGLLYYPIEKVAELVGIKYKDIDNVLNKTTDIYKYSIHVTNNRITETKMYLDPVGVCLFVITGKGEAGKEIVRDIQAVFEAIKSDDPSDIAKVANIMANSHPFVTAYWMIVIRFVLDTYRSLRDFDGWSKLPVQ